MAGGLALGADGSLYVADQVGQSIRRIGPDGIITTVAGNGPGGFSGDGGPATQAKFAFTSGSIAIARDGTLYVADTGSQRIRRIGPDGIINTIAGNGTKGFSGDGGPATQAALFNPDGVALASDGSVYIADTENERIRRVGPDGIITTVAGNGSFCCGSDGGPATGQGTVNGKGAMAVAPNGTLYFAIPGSARIRRVASVLPGFSVGDMAIPSEDGSELYRFTGSGRHLQTVNALTGAVRYQFTYDSASRLVGITDGDGNVTTIHRDASGNPTDIVAPGGQRTTLAVDGNGYLSSIANPAGEAVQFSYTAEGLLMAKSDAKGNLHTFAYDELGRLVSDHDPAGGVKTLSRVDSTNGYAITLTTDQGRTAMYTLTRLPTGQVQRVNSDGVGASTTVLTAPDGSVTVNSPDGTLTTIQRGPDPRFGMLAPVPTSITYSSPGGRTLTQTSQRTATLADPLNPLSLQTLTDTTTINGRTFSSHYVASTRTTITTAPEGRQIIAITDPQGRVVSKQFETGVAPMAVTYDGQGHVTSISQGGQSFTYAYDGANRVISRSDAMGNRRTYAYDAADRLSQVTLPTGRSFQFGYDFNGNRTQITMPSGAAHTFTYTPVDLEASYTPPGNGSYVRGYNGDRALMRSALPSSRFVEPSYDPQRRITGVAYPEAAVAFGYATGDASERTSFITRTPVAVGTGQNLSVTYDGPSETGVTWNGAAQGQYSYTYDNNFFLTALQLVSTNDTVQTSFVRDREGLLTGYGPFTLTRGGPARAVSQISDGTLALTFTYDTLARVTARLQKIGGQQAFQAQLTYDTLGQVIRKVENLAGTTHTYDYVYDADGQLTQVTRDGNIVERYRYDANGNRLSRQLGGYPADLASYDAQDRLLQQGTVTYQFDADGFLAQRGPDSISYSARGELLSATVGGETITYSYDGLGRRVSRTSSAGTTQYLYGSPANVFLLTQVRDPAGVLTTLFYDDGGLLFALERAGARFYVATDQVGTPRLVTDSTGHVVRMLEFDSFGGAISDSNPAFDLPIGFGGGLADASTGLVRLGFRDYDPAAGRWTARDPVRFVGGQGNLFAYVSNDPVNLRDPLGLWCIGGSAYAGFGGGFKVCCTWHGCSACGEVGLGLGAKVQANLSGLDHTGASVGGELRAKCGPVGLGAGVELTRNGCLHGEIVGLLGPGGFSLEVPRIGAEKVMEEKEHEAEAGDESHCGAEGKIRALFCGSTD
jgi:RHS repeat-associated protein